MSINLVLMLAPAESIASAQNLGVIQFLDLVNGRQRLMKLMRKSGDGDDGKPTTEVRPNGTKVMRFAGNEGLRAAMKMFAAEQKKAAATKL